MLVELSSLESWGGGHLSPHFSQLLGEARISWVMHFVHVDPVPVRPLRVDTGFPCAEGPEESSPLLSVGRGLQCLPLTSDLNFRKTEQVKV